MTSFKMVPVLKLMGVIALFCGGLGNVSGKKKNEESLNFYSYPVMDIAENLIPLDEYRGKVSLVVNVASQCGYTDGHYKMLNLVHKMFEETNKFTVLAFPCNQFGGQEPGNHQEIFQFAHERMGAAFPVFAKVNVINQDINPAWKYLIESSGKAPTWNFWKYLVDHNGHVIDAWGPSISPDQLYPNIQKAVDQALEAEASKKKQEEAGENGKKNKEKTKKSDKKKTEKSDKKKTENSDKKKTEKSDKKKTEKSDKKTKDEF